MRNRVRSARRKLRSALRRALYRVWFGRFGYLGDGARISLLARIEHPESISIGANSHISEHCLIGSSPSGHVTLGEDCYVGRFASVIDAGGFVEVGNRVQIGRSNIITGQGGVRIGDAALFAPNVSIIANQHEFGDLDLPIRDQPETGVGVTIGRDGWIGIGAVILDGVSVGDHAVIGANAVVTKDVPSFSIAVGIPAKVQRTMK